jgi:regulatory protein
VDRPRPDRGDTIAARRAHRAEVDDPEEVVAAALRLIEVRQRSVAEVRRRLTRTGYRADLIHAALERLGELRILDDAAFAAAWVESRDRARPRGERALRRELALKGVDRRLVDQVMAARRGSAEDGAAQGVDTTDAETAAAARLLERHAAALARILDPRRRRQRAYALLARHGFDPDVATATVRALEVDGARDEVETDPG